MAIPSPVTGLAKKKKVTDPFGVPHVVQPAAAPSYGGSFPTTFLKPAADAYSGQFPTTFLTPAPTLSGGLQPLAESAPAPTGPAPPDYRSIIQNDPLYQQTQADIAAARISDQASLDAARQRALVNYGDTPDLGSYNALTGDLSGSVNDLTRSLASANTTAGLSTKARIDKAHNDAVKASTDNLTARGLLSSGETGYQLGQQDLSYRQAGSDALQQLVDYLGQAQGGFLSAEAQRRAALAQAATDAAGRIPPDTGGLPGAPAAPTLYDPALDQAAATIGDQYDGGPGYGPPGEYDWTGTPADISSGLDPNGNVVPYNPGSGGLPAPVHAQPPRSVDDIASAYAKSLQPAPKKKPVQDIRTKGKGR